MYCFIATTAHFFNNTATTELYTLSLHDALPIYAGGRWFDPSRAHRKVPAKRRLPMGDRKSTRLNSSHGYISYAVFCLKKKNLLYDFQIFYVGNRDRSAIMLAEHFQNLINLHPAH